MNTTETTDTTFREDQARDEQIPVLARSGRWSNPGLWLTLLGVLLVGLWPVVTGSAATRGRRGCAGRIR